MNKNIIFVTGFIGSDRDGLARRLAQQNGMKFVSLDDEIQEMDGRSVRRIAMTMGEHEVRNKEYEALTALLEQDDLVIACSDGIVLDDQCFALLAQNKVVIADLDKTPEELWEQACNDPAPMYAFFLAEDVSQEYPRYLALYHNRMPIYRRLTQ